MLGFVKFTIKHSTAGSGYFWLSFLHSVAWVMGAVPFSPGSPFLAMPARSFLISAMARPGLRPFGQVLVQFMIVWHLQVAVIVRLGQDKLGPTCTH